MFKLLHSVLVHKFLVGEHRLLGLILVDSLSKALLGCQGGDDWAFDGSRHCFGGSGRLRLRFGGLLTIYVEWS